jgi:hypothetical protein
MRQQFTSSEGTATTALTHSSSLQGAGHHIGRIAFDKLKNMSLIDTITLVMIEMA